jgi:hypothetical protein
MLWQGRGRITIRTGTRSPDMRADAGFVSRPTRVLACASLGDRDRRQVGSQDRAMASVTTWRGGSASRSSRPARRWCPLPSARTCGGASRACPASQPMPSFAAARRPLPKRCSSPTGG